MVGGKLIQRTEKEYRAVERDSYSSLAEYCKSRLSYFKKYVMREKEDEEEDKAILTGQLVESLLPGSKSDFDKKFYLSLCPNPPTETMLSFVNALYKHTEAFTVDGKVTKEFEELCRMAYQDSGYKLKLETVLGKFIGTDAELYYRQLRDTKPLGLKVVCQDDLMNSERIANELSTNPTTAFYVNVKTDDRYTVYDQLQIEDFEFDGLPLKLMGDRIIIDHKDKTVQPCDWKVTWTVEEFIREYYLKRFSYLQAAVTDVGLRLTKMSLGYTSEYAILPMKFVVADSINKYEPLIYSLTTVDIENAITGFKMNGRQYPGLQEIIEDVKWAKENNRFRISRKNYLNGGICQIQEAKG